MTSNDSQAEVRPHVADGIQEYDNPLPRWWLWLLYLTIIYGIGYLIFYHLLGAAGGTSLQQTLAEDDARREAQEQLHRTNVPGNGQSEQNNSDKLLAVAADPSAIAAGKSTFSVNCVPCHGEFGQGVIGPNLTDKSWLHGGSPAAIFKTISEGVPQKGMIAWSPILGEEKVMQLVGFVRSLQGTNPTEAKAAEGTVEE